MAMPSIETPAPGAAQTETVKFPAALYVAAVVLIAMTALACPAGHPDGREWADVPLIGMQPAERATLAELLADPDAYRGKTVRMSLRVVSGHRDARGVWLRVVPAGAPPGAQHVKLLIPKHENGAELLESPGREIDVVLTIDRPVATMAYESAFEVRPIAHVTRFSSSSRGDEEAASVREQIEKGNEVP